MNLTSPKYLTGGAILVVALGVVVFVLTHRGGPEKAPESKVAESKAAETAAVQQPQPPAEKKPSESPAPETQSAAAPANAPNPDLAGEKPRTGGKEGVKAKDLARAQADQSSLNASADKTQLNAANTARAPGSANPAPTSNRVRISQGVSHGMLMREVAPKYPPLARSARVQGQVVLDVVIGKDGSVSDITTKSGHPMLVPAAIEAVKQWRYQPYRLDGKPVEVNTEVVVIFTLTN